MQIFLHFASGIMDVALFDGWEGVRPIRTPTEEQPISGAILP
jgi:hypothetical protein